MEQKLIQANVYLQESVPAAQCNTNKAMRKLWVLTFLYEALEMMLAANKERQFDNLYEKFEKVYFNQCEC